MSQYYSSGTINIPSVTGDVVISVTAVESALVNLFPNSFLDTDGTVYNNGLGYKNNYRIRGVLTEEASNGSCISGYLDVSGYTTLTISGCSDRSSSAGGMNLACYDSSYNSLSSETTAIGATYAAGNNPNGTWTIPTGVKYIRFSCGNDPTNAVVYLS